MAEKKDDGKEDKKPDSGIAAVLNVIPSVYYDLIARIAPGAAFWIALGIKAGQPLNLQTISAVTPQDAVILVFLGYLTGMVLTGIALPWDYACLAIFRRLPETARSGLGLEKNHTLLEQWGDVAERMDRLDRVCPEAGRTVAKALAEVTLCQNLLSGLLVLACIGFISDGALFARPAGHLLPLGLVLAMLFAAMVFREAMFLGRVQTLHGIYCPQ